MLYYFYFKFHYYLMTLITLRNSANTMILQNSNFCIMKHPSLNNETHTCMSFGVDKLLHKCSILKNLFAIEYDCSLC